MRGNRTFTCAAVLALTMMLTTGSAEAQTDSVDVVPFGGGPPTGGRSHLTRTDTMLLGVTEAVGLVPGHAYTVWWVIFNNPAACMTIPCSADDIPFADTGIGNATGNVAKTDGTAEFGGQVSQGDITNGGQQVLRPAPGGGGAILTVPPAEAEVHLLIQTHGQARGGRQLLGQLSRSGFGCTPGCGNVQAGIHLALP